MLVSNFGEIVYFDSKGNGVALPCTIAVSNPQDVGLVQSDLFDHTPLPPLQLREVELLAPHTFLAVEDGAPYGRGSVLSFVVK